IEENERKHRNMQREISELRRCQTNKVTAFGGERVLRLLQMIEKHNRKFKSSPIGPIGAHVLTDSEDGWVWWWEKAGLFSVRPAYRCITDGGLRHSFRQQVWSSRSPLNVLIWRISHGRLPIRDRLRRFILDMQPTCVLCGDEDETISHLSVGCSYFQDVWREVGRKTRFNLGQLRNVHHLLWQWRDTGISETLLNGGTWSMAVETAIGRLLDAFIVTDHKDSLVLRNCAKEANYTSLQIIIYDFSRPRLNIPGHMLPRTSQPTVLSVLHSDSDTVINTLVDMASIERLILVEDYDMGKSVAFEQRPQNLKDVYTSDGFRMFFRGSVQTILPPNKRIRAGRLCSSIDDQISRYEKEAMDAEELVHQAKVRKRDFDEQARELELELQSMKRQRTNDERLLMSKKLNLQDKKNVYAAERGNNLISNADELHQEILKLKEEIKGKESSLEEIKMKRTAAEEKANSLKLSHEKLCESTKEEICAIEEAEKDLLEKSHYDRVMHEKVLTDIKEAEAVAEKLHLERQGNFEKSSKICSEKEMESVGGCAKSSSEQLSAQLKRIDQRLKHERLRFSESIDDLRAIYQKKERKILKKRQTYEAFREKLHACQEALDLRWNKFQRNATLLKRQLTWQFNGHLRKKGISGHVKVNYEEKTLSVEVNFCSLFLYLGNNSKLHFFEHEEFRWFF
ncbi:hypothetical protein Taro_035941, partial [Colocasia esculenta]|nr:hypothetical protein [Colocasia esculenta]